MDMSWLSREAKSIHLLFSSLFYSFVVVLLLIGVITNFFKMSLGQVPEFMSLLGRALLASLILVSLPETMNTLADLTDQMAGRIGELNNLELVVQRLGEKIGNLTFSWVSVKDSILMIVSYLTFFLLYVSVYVIESMFILSWTLIYIFSPVLIAAFTLPSTSNLTKGLFQTLFEVCLWKICWAVLAGLLWSFALSEINNPQYDVDFLTAILLNIMLSFSLILTPFVVRSFVKGGSSSVASQLGSVVFAAAALTPSGMSQKLVKGIKTAGNQLKSNSEDGEAPYRKIPKFKGRK